MLPRIPVGNDGPVFAEPWQAQAFALAVKLSELGHFTWKEWAATLAEELRAAEDRGEPDDGSHYYEHWLVALERLVTAKKLTDRTELATRKDAWADAYRHTPHGKPVELGAATHESNATHDGHSHEPDHHDHDDDDHPHDHDHDHDHA